MKKMILPMILMMIATSAMAEKKMKPASYLKGKAFVYKISEVEKKDGTLEDEIKEVCQKDILIPTFKLTSGDSSSGTFASGFAPQTCFVKVMGEDVTLAFDAYHMDALVLPGKIANEQGLNAWINSRVNGIIGMTYMLPERVSFVRDEKTGDYEWLNGNKQLSENTMKTLEYLPKYQNSVSYFRGSVHNGFSVLLELQTTDVCERIKDEELKVKCNKDGYYRVVLVYEGKK